VTITDINVGARGLLRTEVSDPLLAISDTHAWISLREIVESFRCPKVGRILDRNSDR
jgi:hypothetical protein